MKRRWPRRSNPATSPVQRSMCSRPSRPPQSPLFGLENVVCTPHLGAATAEAQENVALQVAEQMSDFLLTGAVSNAINMPSVSAEDAPRLKPYMELCRLLGAFAGQLTQAREGVIRRVLIEYEGHAAAAEHASADRRRTRRPDDAGDGGHQHGQRAGSRARPRYRCRRDCA